VHCRQWITARGRSKTRDRGKSRRGILSDELLAVEQRHWSNVIESAFVDEDIVIRRRIVAAAVVEGLKRCEARKRIRETTTTCYDAGRGVVVDEPDHTADGDADSGAISAAAIIPADRVAESVSTFESGRR